MIAKIIFRSFVISLVFVAGATGAFSHASLDIKSASQGPMRAAVRIPHGCEGSPTVAVNLSIPEGIVGVKPAPKPRWKVSIKTGPYNKAYNFMHGSMVSEGVKEIEWQGGPLLDENFDEFQFIGFITDAFASGNMVVFPVTQKCEKGQIVWSEIAGPSVDPHSLKLPAPSLKIVAASSTDKLQEKGKLTVSKAWARATPGGAIVGAGYLKIINASVAEDTLLKISTPIAKRAELHSMFEDKGVMNMRILPEGLVIPAGKTVELKPSGYHLMFLDLKSPLVQGQKFNADLTFAKAGKISVTFDVLEIGAKEGPADHSHHH